MSSIESTVNQQTHPFADPPVIAQVYQSLQQLMHLTKRIERVHADHKNVPLGLSHQLVKLQSELEGNQINSAIERITLITDAFKLPSDACGSWQLLNEDLLVFKFILSFLKQQQQAETQEVSYG